MLPGVLGGPGQVFIALARAIFHIQLSNGMHPFGEGRCAPQAHNCRHQRNT